MNINNITVSSDMSQLKSGLKTAFLKHYGNTIMLQTPKMFMPFKPGSVHWLVAKETVHIGCETSSVSDALGSARLDVAGLFLTVFSSRAWLAGAPPWSLHQISVSFRDSHCSGLVCLEKVFGVPGHRGACNPRPRPSDLSEEGDRHTLCLNVEDDSVFASKLKDMGSFVTKLANAKCQARHNIRRFH
eukprot:SAG31_NODE_248_length_19104_cov_3.721019_10_plen_187_part_00